MRLKQQSLWASAGEIQVLHKLCGVTVFSVYVRQSKATLQLHHFAVWQGEMEEGSSPRMAMVKLRKLRGRVKQVERIQGEIVAYRVWKLMGDLLRPVGVDTWNYTNGPVMVADERPTLDNHNGFWAVKKCLIEGVAQSYNYDVIGRVGLYGRVVEHTKGWRAEKLTIQKLFVRIPCSAEFIDLLSRRYQCDVEQRTTLNRAGEYEPTRHHDWGDLL